MSILNYIIWDVSPEIINTGKFALRWYGLLFALGFVFGNLILKNIYRKEGKSLKDLDQLTMYIVLATVAGARLGHCLFYEPYHYLSHPLEIFKVWEGGLASHGAAIGILLAVNFYTKKYPKYTYLWIMDRLVITIALGACFIRIGNLMNSEIIGRPTNLPWAFVFTSIDVIPRHPAQLYESIGYLLLFLSLIYLYRRKGKGTPKGSLFGIFLITTFMLRFLVEFLKENQVPFENQMFLNMGQSLSIPLILAGIYFLVSSYCLINSPKSK